MSGTQWPALNGGSGHSRTSTRGRGRPCTRSRTASSRARRSAINRSAAGQGARRPADGADAVDHLLEIRGVERHDLGVAADHRERLLDGAGRHGADLAEVLGQDDVRVDGPDPVVVEGVDRLARSHAGAHLGVDLRRAP